MPSLRRSPGSPSRGERTWRGYPEGGGEKKKTQARNLALRGSCSTSTSASYTGQGPRCCRLHPSWLPLRFGPHQNRLRCHGGRLPTHTPSHALPPSSPPPPQPLDLSVCFITPGASPADSVARYLSSARSPLAGRREQRRRGWGGEKKGRGWKLPGAFSSRCCWCCRCCRRLRLLARPLSASMCRIVGAPWTLLPLLAALLQVRDGPSGGPRVGWGEPGGTGSLCSPRCCGAGLRTREGRCGTARPGAAQTGGSGRAQGQGCGGELVSRASPGRSRRGDRRPLLVLLWGWASSRG